MPITINFSHELPDSLQIGDTAYHGAVAQSGGFTVSSNNYIEIGVITDIVPFNGTTASIICNNDVSTHQAAANDFIFFKKEASVNQGKVKGYSAKVTFYNDHIPAFDPDVHHTVDYVTSLTDSNTVELYAVSANVFNSSK
tara:strand:- start:1952 stop:2371 length:420 start_codon:yes stop_codon:yes gene_type:complete